MTPAEKYEESKVDLLGERKLPWMMSANETWYHGSFSDFNKFSRRKRGDNTGANSAKEGFFFASNPEVAISYASDLTIKLHKLHKRLDVLRQLIETISGESYIRTSFNLMQERYPADLARQLEPLCEEAASIELELGGMDESYFNSQELAGSLKVVTLEYINPYEEDMDFHGIAHTDSARKIREARQKGHDAVIFRNTYDGGNPVGADEPTDIIIVFNNSQVKDKKKAVGAALAKGKYQQAIKEGRMTAENAVAIIKSVNLPLPAGIAQHDGLGQATDKRSPAWYRTRLSTINYLIRNTPYKDEKINNDVVLLRNGVIPAHAPDYYDLEGRVSGFLQSGVQLISEPLDFSEITCFNTWFEMHPDKVFGKEIVSTSVQFPLTIKGNRSDIDSGFRKFLDAPAEDRSGKRERTKLKALALALELELLTL